MRIEVNPQNSQKLEPAKFSYYTVVGKNSLYFVGIFNETEALRCRCLTRRSSVVPQLPFRPDPISAYRFCAIRSITNHTGGVPQSDSFAAPLLYLCTYQCNVYTYQCNSLPTGKSFQSNATKFPHPRMHTAVNPKAEPKKGTTKISPNKTLQSFINVAASPKIHVPVTAAIIRSNHNPCYTA